MSDIKTFLDSRHFIYGKYCSFWNFLLTSYEGGKEYVKDDYVTSQKVTLDGKALDLDAGTNLFKHTKEREDDYRQRVKMSYYYNFCAPIIDIYTNHLFKKPVISDFKEIDEIVNRRKENIDKKNSSIAEFRKEVASLCQIYGHIFVVVDKPQSDTQPQSFQQQIDKDLFPYFSIYYPQNVLNWALDEFGEPYWVLLKETLDSNIDISNFDKDKAAKTRYRVWTRTECIIYNEAGEEEGRISHTLGRVPVVCIYSKKSKKYPGFFGVSSIADISYIARDVYNKCSELNQIIRDQTFSILTIQGESSEYNEKSVGTNRALLYPTDRQAPAFISPDSGNAEILMKQIDRQITAMFRLAKLEGGSAKFSGQSAVEQSGVSKAWDFNETNQALADIADNLQDAEMKLWTLVSLWEGKKTFTGSVQYPDDFDVQRFFDELDEAEKALKLQIGTMFNKEIKKQLIRKKFSRLSESELKKMEKEVEDNEGKSEGGRLLDRLMNKTTENANSGGKEGEGK